MREMRERERERDEGVCLTRDRSVDVRALDLVKQSAGDESQLFGQGFR